MTLFKLMTVAELTETVHRLQWSIDALEDAESRGTVAMYMREHYRAMLREAEAERSRRSERCDA